MTRKNRIEVSGKTLLVYALLFLFTLLLFLPEDFFKKPSIIGETLGIVRILGTNAPFFDPPLTNFTVNQTLPFFFDVNCSDLDALDPSTYYENFTGFAIANDTGIINVSGFNQNLIGNHSIEFMCIDTFGYNTTATILFRIIDSNDPPVLSPIGPQIAVEGQPFTLDVDATDSDNDTLTFGVVTALFSIDPSNGTVYFTPTFAQIGNYTINFTVYDGSLYDHEIVSFRIIRGPFCGDDSCGSTETCESCPTDCGACNIVPGSDTGGESSSSSGGGAGAAQTSASGIISPQAGASQAPLFQCEEKWECSAWSICSIDGLRTRNCVDINRCNTQRDKPIAIEQCQYQPTCFDGIQNGGETGVDCGGPCEPCLIESCFDGVQNQGETGIDCGGPCNSCLLKEFTKAPFLEIPGIIKIPRQFPWLLLILIAIILAITIAWDQNKVRKIRALPFIEYQEEMRKYRPFRRKLYRFVLNTSMISLTISFYIYIFSNNFQRMLYFSFIPIMMVALTPFVVVYILRHFEYYEYQHLRKLRHMKETHIREILQLIKVENEALHDLESKLKERIVVLAKNREFAQEKELYGEINTLFADISVLRKKRETRISLMRISNEVLDKIIAILESKNLVKGSRAYAEYLSIQKELKYIEDNRDKDTSEEEDYLLEDIKELAMPYMKVVNESDKGLTALYNALVDVYGYYENVHEQQKFKDAEIMQVERSFSDKVKALSKKAALISKIQQNKEYASIYNAMVDLFNHYSKKHQLSKSLENV